MFCHRRNGALTEDVNGKTEATNNWMADLLPTPTYEAFNQILTQNCLHVFVLMCLWLSCNKYIFHSNDSRTEVTSLVSQFAHTYTTKQRCFTILVLGEQSKKVSRLFNSFFLSLSLLPPSLKLSETDFNCILYQCFTYWCLLQLPENMNETVFTFFFVHFATICNLFSVLFVACMQYIVKQVTKQQRQQSNLNAPHANSQCAIHIGMECV